MEVIYKDTDNLLELKGLKNEATGAWINDATVTATLVDSDGEEVEGQSWPATVAYVSGSNGDYRGTLANTLSLSEGAEYVAKVTATGGGLKLYAELVITAKIRRSR